MKKAHIKSLEGGRKPYRVNKSDLSASGADFYSHVLPELWSLKLKARQRMGLTNEDTLPQAVNQ